MSDSAAILLICAVVTTVNVAYWLTYRYVNEESPEEKEIASRIDELKKVTAKLIPSVDFVPWSRNTRVLNQLPKELAAAKAKRLLARPEGLLAAHSRYITPITYALLSLLYWNRPLALLPPSICSPFCWVLAYPGQESGALGILGWLLLLQVTIVPAIPVILRSLSIVPSEKEAQGLASLMQSASKFIGALGK